MDRNLRKKGVKKNLAESQITAVEDRGPNALLKKSVWSPQRLYRKLFADLERKKPEGWKDLGEIAKDKYKSTA